MSTESIDVFFPPVQSAEITSKDCGMFGNPRPNCRLVREGKAKATRTHKGIDLRASVGTKIFASQDGQVTFVGYQGKTPSRNQAATSFEAAQVDRLNQDIAGGGIMVFIRHSPTLETRYMHLSSFNVSMGDFVKAADFIALSGDSGDAKGGPHLHFEVHQNGIAIDPFPFLFPKAANV